MLEVQLRVDKAENNTKMDPILPPCKSQFPTVSDYFYNIDPVTLLFTILACIAALFTCVIFVFHSRSIGHNVLSEHRRSLLRILAALFPVVSLCCCIGLCVPATLRLMIVFIPAYFARALIAFTSLVRDLFGGRAGMAITLEESGIQIHLASRPCCCCCKCLPDAKPTWANIKTLENMVVQAAVIRGLLAFLVFVLFANGSEIGTTSTTADFVVIVSTSFGMYGAYVFTHLAEKVRPMYKVKRLMNFLQGGYMLLNLQGIVFRIVASAGGIQSGPILTAEEKAYVWHSMALTIELFLLSLLASKMLAPGVCGLYDDAQPVQKRLDSFAIENGSNSPIESSGTFSASYYGSLHNGRAMTESP